MSNSLPDLRAKLSAFGDNLLQLGGLSAVAARRMTEDRAVPDEAFLVGLSDLLRDWRSLVEEVEVIAAEAGIQPAIVQTLPELTDRIRSVEDRLSESSGALESVLDHLRRASRLRHVQRDFLPLSACHEEAERLLHTLSGSRPSEARLLTEQLTLGDHPLAALLQLTEPAADLDDDTWSVLEARVEKAFGRDVAVAAVRGRLHVLAADPPVAAVAVPVMPIPATMLPVEATPRLPASTISATPLSETTHPPPVIETVPLQSPPPKATEPSSAQLTTLPSPSLKSVEVKPEEVAIPPDESLTGETTPTVEALPTPPMKPAEETALLAVVPATPLVPTPSTPIPQIARTARDLVWLLLGEKRQGLAYYLGRCLERLHPNLHPRLPSWLLRALALAGCVRHPEGDVAARLREDLGQFSTDCFEGDSGWNSPMRLLLAAASLQPALVAPDTGAGFVLNSLHLEQGLGRFYDFTQEIVRFNARRLPLDLNSLKSLRDRAAWRDRIEKLTTQIRSWLAEAPARRMSYQAASRIWQEWVQPQGLLGSLLNGLVANSGDDLPADQHQRALADAHKSTTRFNDPVQFRHLVDEYDPRAQKRKQVQITGPSFNQLRGHAHEAVTFVEHWCDLQQLRPLPTGDFRQKEANKLGARLVELRQAVDTELNALSDRANANLRAAIGCCRIALDHVEHLFDPSREIPSEDGCTRRVLQADLLFVPDVRLDPNWEPEETDESLFQALARYPDGIQPDARSAFEVRLEQRDISGAAQVLEYLDHPPDLEDRCRTTLEQCREALQRDLEVTRKQVEAAVGLGLIPQESDRTKLVAEIDALELVAQIDALNLAAQERVRFNEAHARLVGVREQLTARKSQEIDRIRHEFQALGLAADHPAAQRIVAALDQNDAFRATEYIQLARDNHELPFEDVSVSAFFEFFPDRAEQLGVFLAKPGARKTATRAVRGKEPIPGLDMSPVLREHAERAAEMLETWFMATIATRIDKQQVRTIFGTLGWNVIEIQLKITGNLTWVDVTTDPLRHRLICPVATFGSQAKGRYRVLCVWDRPNEEDLINRVGDASVGQPTIVFYFGQLTPQRRRDLARLSMKKGEVLVLDDILLVNLCGARASRLPILFECALPFTTLDVYPITPGLVPPEMFYGRTRELQSVLDPFGSCFIYGGRQLGKTALLRHAEAQFKQAKKNKAIFLDLKAAGIGPSRELWPVLVDEFKKRDVLEPTVPSHIGADKLLDHVHAWLDADAERKLLLLLDESDQFLSFDAKPQGEPAEERGGFQRVAKLKGLMDRTNRRFKVVFAGLHNVQRTTRLENHPLAQYGLPICIGPLFSDGEWCEARALIERPFACLGYYFDPPDLVMRILSQTNYYPSLIQLYCHYLLRHVRTPARVRYDPKKCPPFPITSQHLQAVYESDDLRKAIRDRFVWTLQLDERYEVIAHVIAYCIQADARKMTEGFRVDEIRHEVHRWWPEGFVDSSEGSLRVLLDEMVGLGILRITNARFTLRSPNVIHLIGTTDEIENTLLRHREKPLEYEPAVFRAPYRDIQHDDQTCRNPLTAGQESELRRAINGVSLLFGCRAAGLKDLSRFLRLAFGNDFFYQPQVLEDAMAFQHALDALKKREKDGVTLLLVGADVPWTVEWVERAMKKVKDLKSAAAHVRVLFVADPRATWRLLDGGCTPLDALREGGVSLFSLEPWKDAALRQWLEDCQFAPPGPEIRKEVSLVTGNWPLLLDDWRRLFEGGGTWKFHLEAFETALRQPIRRQEVARSFGLDTPGAQEPLRVLAQLDELRPSAADLAQELKTSPEALGSFLTWLNLLSLGQEDEQGWRLDPVVVRVLSEQRASIS